MWLNAISVNTVLSVTSSADLVVFLLLLVTTKKQKGMLPIWLSACLLAQAGVLVSVDLPPFQKTQILAMIGLLLITISAAGLFKNTTTRFFAAVLP